MAGFGDSDDEDDGHSSEHTHIHSSAPPRLDDMMRAISQRMGGPSIADLESAKEKAGLILPIIRRTRKHRAQLEQFLDELARNFPPQLHDISREARAAHIYHTIEHPITLSLSNILRDQLKLASLQGYTSVLEGSGLKEFSAERLRTRGYENYQQQMFLEAYHGTEEAANQIVSAWLSGSVNINTALEGGIKAVAIYQAYLRERFLKPADEEPDKRRQIMVIRNPGEERTVSHVKLKLLEGNAPLTDLLLDFSRNLPRGREIVQRRKGDPRVQYSHFAVTEAARKLITISDPTFLGYLDNPNSFFTNIANAATAYLNYIERSAKEVQQLIASNNTIALASTLRDSGVHPQLIGQILQDGGNIARLRKLAERVRGIALDDVVQREEDYRPDNERERKTQELLTRQLTGLYEAMKTIAKVSTGRGSEDRKENRKEVLAYEAITTALELNVEIEQLQRSRRLRQRDRDLDDGNLFYVGTQGMLGEFGFERAEAPLIREEDVIGKSFDQAKERIALARLTAQYPHLMRMSSPTGTVKANLMLIGPPGCGKTELIRAVGGSPDVIGAAVGIHNIETAWAGEKVGNVGRVFTKAAALYEDNRAEKPVGLGIDEMEGWFEGHSARQVETVLLQMLDGAVTYDGVFTMALTNKPELIPGRIMRRFQYVGIVGELEQDERARLMKMFVERGLPVEPRVEEYYGGWAGLLADAPGDVVRKIADVIHSDILPVYIAENPRKARSIERILRERDERRGHDLDADRAFVKRKLREHGIVVGPEHIEKTVGYALSNPGIRREISEAKTTYRNAHEMLAAIQEGAEVGDGFSYHRPVGFRLSDRLVEKEIKRRIEPAEENVEE